MALRLHNAVPFSLIALACMPAFGQEYSFRYFGIAEGLTNLAVRQIYQDRVGFIWVSTEDGIFRFDGERFEPFGPAQGIPITPGAAFGDAPDGSLLAGGDFGLYRLRGNRFERVPLEGKVNWAQGIQSDGNGHTFVGTDAGLVELYNESGRMETRPVPRVSGTSGREAYGVLADGGALWYGCGLELCFRDRDGTRVFGRGNGLPNSAWLVIRKDGNGNLWVRGKNAGVLVVPRGQTRFRRPDSPLPPATLNGVPQTDADGNVLLPSPVGLLIRDETGWRKIDRRAGLRGTVYAVFEDRQHSLWIGLAGQGLARWRGYREWQNYTSESGLTGDIVYEILPAPDNSVWVATEGGLFRGTKDAAGMNWKRVPGVGAIPIHSVRMAPGGDIWIGTETHGAARIRAGGGGSDTSGSEKRSVEWLGDAQGLTASAPYALRFDRRRRLWAATDAGLFVAQAPYRRFSRVEELPATRFWALAEGTDGSLRAGGADGLFRYAAGLWTNLTRADGLSNQEVISLGAGPDGRIWIGYRFGGGIDRIRDPAGSAYIEKGVQRRGTDGLVYFLDFDASGRLWAGTEHGVDVWDGSHWTHYDSRDGLAWDDCNLNAFAAEPDGTVWIGTSGGLSRFTPRPQRAAPLFPRVVFTKLIMGSTDVSGRSDPSAGIRSNNLIAGYSVLNAPRENSIVFRYRLTPSATTWTETTQRQLEFAQLGPGAYRLEAEARDGDSDRKWTGHAEFAFEIPTPWYRSWWFLGACGLVPLLIAAGVLRLRMMSAKTRERDLIRIVEEKTVDLRRANEDLLRLSSLDPLTGLANRRVFDQTLERECARLKRTDSAVSLVMLDVDSFKALNDSAGHQRGDEYLVAVGSELSRFARRGMDTIARYGGEEFALILPETRAPEAMTIAESVRVAIALLALPHSSSEVAPVLTVSIGVSTGTSECCGSPEDLLGAADQALYIAKRAGRNRVEAVEPRPREYRLMEPSGYSAHR